MKNNIKADITGWSVGAISYIFTGGEKKFIMFLYLLLAITVIVLYFKIKDNVTAAIGIDAFNGIFLTGGIISFVLVLVLFLSGGGNGSNNYQRMR
jgi:hypothetical protein